MPPPLPRITVYSPVRHPRLRYVLAVVGDDLGYRLRLRTDLDKWKKLEEYKISYGVAYGERGLPAHPFLSGRDPTAADLRVDHGDGLPTFFATPDGPDLLACCFFALSRYEEYDDFTPDAHGRFPADRSHAVVNDYLHRPVVREWAAAIGRQLTAWFPELPPPRRRPFLARPTYDVDAFWAYHHRGWRGGASGLRDLLTGRPARVLARLRSRPATDPFNTFDRLEDLHGRLGLSPVYFWLLAAGSDARDPNPFPIPPAQQATMRRLAERHPFGIHPSYGTPEEPELTGRELARLTEITGRRTTRSRQHFLRFRLPDTPRQLLRAGIDEDYSMGYADRVGWRAGTNLPFPWYDLERERVSRLRLVPFVAMDVTLRKYLGLSGADAGAVLRQMAADLLPYGGDFYLLWHNSSFSPDHGWAGWWSEYESLLAELVELE